jgi:uncharacterized protein YjbI with pentapeptide repeats
MANEEHLAILRQGGEVWNSWRKAYLSPPDLSNAELSSFTIDNYDLSFANLQNVNLSSARLNCANLQRANLKNANLQSTELKNADLRFADLSNADLRYTELTDAKLTSANLCGADLRDSDLRNAHLNSARIHQTNFSGALLIKANLIDTHLSSTNFSNSDLSEAQLCRAILSWANLSGAILSEANLISASLLNANLSKADLSGANLINTNLNEADLRFSSLHEAQVLEADFKDANLTGACIANWHVGTSTRFEGVVCEYIYRTIDKDGNFSGRLPIDPNSTFASGEFTKRFQILESALETIDITFTEGIDWQAFFHSFQELRSQNPDTDISIQGMERKAEGFIVRLEVNQEADKAAIETQAKQFYAQQLQVLEAQYEERLRLQGAHLEDIRELLSFERQERTRLSKVVETMASEQQTPKYDLRGAQFAGGFAEVVKGNQYGGTINNYGQNTDDIVRLLTSLRDLAQEFPEAQRVAVQVHLEDLATDLDQPEKCQPARLKTRIAGLFGVLLMLGGGVATATDFANNVLELSKKLDFPAETFRPQLEQFKQIYPEF